MDSILRIAAYVIYGLVAFLLVGAILIQESKGGGLAALGGTRAETAFGSSNPVRRLTVVLAVIFFGLAGLMGWWLPRGEKASEGTRITAPEGPGAATEPAAPTTEEEPAAPAEETGQGPEEPAEAPAEEPGAGPEGPGAPGDEAGPRAEEPATPAAGP